MRLTKGAGTHLASWLQECKGLSIEEGLELLNNSKEFPKESDLFKSLIKSYGKTVRILNIYAFTLYCCTICVYYRCYFYFQLIICFYKVMIFYIYIM